MTHRATSVSAPVDNAVPADRGGRAGVSAWAGRRA